MAHFWICSNESDCPLVILVDQAKILYYITDDTPIVVKQFIFLNTCPLQASEKIKRFKSFSMDFVNTWASFKVTRHIYSKTFGDGILLYLNFYMCGVTSTASIYQTIHDGDHPCMRRIKYLTITELWMKLTGCPFKIIVLGLHLSQTFYSIYSSTTLFHSGVKVVPCYGTTVSKTLPAHFYPMVHINHN